MTATLLLRLAAPMQSWGASSRFTRRTTETQPTKSGVIGLLAAAMGRRRTDPLEDLLGLRFGVRIDQPGHLLRDFQTARSLDGQKVMPLSHRYYINDGVFLAAVEGTDTLIGTLHDAVREPRFPLYLGRRSCPPAGPLTLGTRPDSLREVLASEPYAAARHVRRRQPQIVPCEVLTDALPGETPAFTSRDVPQSFNPEGRRYTLRTVTRYPVDVPNPQGRADPPQSPNTDVDAHDPLQWWEAN